MERQSHILERVSDALVALDKNWRYTYVNERAAALFGRTPEQLIGRHIWTEFPEGVGQPFQRAYEKAMAEQTFIQMENYYEPWDRWFENRIYPSPEGLSIFFHEITERKRAERAANENAQLLGDQNRILELIARGAPLHDTLDLLLRVIESRAPSMLCSILLLDADGVHLRHGAAPSLPTAFLKAVDGQPIGPRAGSCGTAAFRREQVIVEDITTDPLWQDYRALAAEHGLRACWSTPIVDGRQRVLGTFAMYFRTPGTPDAAQLRLVDLATQTATIAIVEHQERRALRASEERQRLAVTSGHIGIWEWNVDTNGMEFSDELKAIFGWAGRHDLRLRTFMDAIHPDDQSRVKGALRKAVDQGTTFDEECRILRADGELRWIAGKGRAEYDAAGTPVRMMGVALDVTDRRRAEQEVSEREAQLAEAQRIAHVGSYEWDIGANRVSRSEELCRIFGLRPDEFPPTFEAYLDRVHPDDRPATRAAVEHAVRAGTSFEFEERIVLPDGSTRVLHSQGTWVRDAQGRPVKLVGICQDITERKQAEERIRRGEMLELEIRQRRQVEQLLRARNDELKTFASMVSHELKAPLRAIAGYAAELDTRHSAGFSTRAHDCVQRIRSAAHDLDRLIEDLLQYARLDAETPTATCVNLARLIDALLQERRATILEQGTQVTVNLQVAGIVSWERGMRQVLANLIDNALKYSRCASPPAVQISSEPRGDGALIAIKDNGIGFDMKYHDRMFGMFERLVRQEDFEGTGAGLAIVKKVVDKSGGRIWAESAPGAGATFFVEMPRRDAEGAEA